MASASEMGRFAVAFLKEAPPLSRTLLARVSTAHAEIPYDLPDMKRPRYGYGLFLHEWDGVAIAEHPGTMPGFTSILKMAPRERFAVILLANQEGMRFEKTMAAAFAPYRKGAAPPQAPPAPRAMTESEMEAVAGVYRNRWPVSIVHEMGALHLEQFGARMPVAKTGVDLFEADPGEGRRPIPFRILPGSDGQGELLQIFLWLFRKEEPSARALVKGAPS
jgi:hypothetical protein